MWMQSGSKRLLSDFMKLLFNFPSFSFVLALMLCIFSTSKFTHAKQRIQA